MNNLKGLIAVIIAILPLYGAVADIMPDYYAEPGLNPSRDYLNQHANEYIDPFTGLLQLHYIDITIPGNGGMDINVHRSYTAPEGSLGVRTPTGVGWSIHFGMIRKSTNTACYDQSLLNINDNPVLILPDGSQHLMYNSSTESNYQNYLFMTQDKWVAECKNFTVTTSSGVISNFDGYVVKSPEGTVYEYGYYDFRGSTPTWLVSRITDSNGNQIDITYEDLGATGYTLIDHVSTSDGRTLQFNYVDKSFDTVRLSSIVAGNQTWGYNYEAVPNDGTNHYFLKSVTRPDGLEWQYEYNQYDDPYNAYAVNKVTYPYGATISYQYTQLKFDPAGSNVSHVIYSKTVAGLDLATGTWYWDYQQDSQSDLTIVTATDNSKLEYEHYGFQSAAAGSMWKIGLLKAKRFYDANQVTPVQTTTYDWDKQRISGERYRRSTRSYASFDDPESYAPIQTNITTVRDGATYSTQYGPHDVYGNPSQIAESGNSGSYSKQTNLTYYNNTLNGKWIVNIIDNETILGVTGSIDRSFYDNGNLKSVNKYGVTTQYTYTSQGDVATVKDANLKTTTYSNYKRGIPGTENHPENVTITRVVNDDGTIASVTNGRGKTSSYSYDNMGRITAIYLPTHDSFSVTWLSNGKTITRGTYTEQRSFDGLGRDVLITQEGISTTIAYDSLGHNVFMSDPGSSITGTNYEYDVLGRLTKEKHVVDNTFITYSYPAGGNKVKITDENNHATTYTYESFGNPDEKMLVNTQTPEGIATSIVRNKFGQVQSVTQNNLTRTYGYNARYQLTSVTSPELSVTTYGRDTIGNMISSRVGSSGVTNYTYDNLHRLIYIDYPGTTPDVTKTYDANSNVKTLASGTNSRIYTYDDNDNLINESIAIGLTPYLVTYTYDGLDHLNTIQYPSGRIVNYSPNDLGQATAAMPILSSVSYFPGGQLKNVSYANGKVMNYSLTSRKWLNQITGVIGLDYNYDNKGNITSVTNSLLSTYSVSQLTYDNNDRLRTAYGNWGLGSIAYDDGGNITSKTMGSETLSYAYDNLKNRLNTVSGSVGYTFAYDSYGNVTSNGVSTFVYDDASNMRTSTTNNITVTNDYDGNNLRVSRSVGGEVTNYVYSMAGNLLGLYEATGEFIKEYVYLGSSQVALVINDYDNDGLDYDEELKLGTDPHNPDTDGDGVNDSLDVFPFDPTEWADNDGDMTGDNADTDDDNDGLSDTDEAVYGTNPLNADTDDDNMNDLWEVTYIPFTNPLLYDIFANLDGDGWNNGTEYNKGTDPSKADTDGDNVNDDHDAFPVDSAEWLDTDKDGIGNNTDTDDDNDGYLDTADVFPLDKDEWADADGDLIGDNGDPDDDNDLMPDRYENQYGLDSLNPGDATTDYDFDGSTAAAEYHAGTDPTDYYSNSKAGMLVSYKVIAKDTGAFHEFGRAMAADGDQVLIGAPGQFELIVPDAYMSTGAAYVFVKQTDGSWSQQAKLVVVHPQYQFLGQTDFGASVALSGNIAVVGAPSERDSVSEQGAVYIFKNDGNGNWSQLQKLLLDSPSANDQFGYSVAISGNKILISSLGRGRAYVYTDSASGTWVQEAILSPSDATYADFHKYLYGLSVAIDGDRALISAPAALQSPPLPTKIGAVYMYTNDGTGTWSERTIIHPDVPQSNEYFGNSLSISGSNIVVGAPYNNENVSRFGAVYFFQIDNADVVSQVTKQITPDSAKIYDYLGVRVSLSGSRVIASAKERVYLFELVNGNWEFSNVISARDGQGYEHFGNGLAITGDTLVVGAYFDDDSHDKFPGEVSGGSTYFYNLDADGDGVIDIIGDSDNDGMPDSYEMTIGTDIYNAGDAVGDLDGDGLNNLAEYLAGTNLLVQDSDGDGYLDGADDLPLDSSAYLDTDHDGMPDQFETTYNLDPLDPSDAGIDTDGDGLSNLEEYQSGKNPLVPDNGTVINRDGDVNGDGTVNVADILLAQQHVLNLITLTPEQVTHADVYPANGGDGEITLPDLLYIQQMALGLR